MKILVHTCCAPCLIYPQKRLRQEGFEVECFYYNPNIHPPAEYQKRKEYAEKYTRELGIKTHSARYDMKEYFRQVNEREEAPLRCNLCWKLRLEETARFAKENGFEIFTTTLLVSPYQNTEELKKIGEKAAEKAGIKFYFEDFKKGYSEAVTESKERNIYRQKYCGCLYSLKK